MNFIKNLKNNKNIIIKKADKGSAVVLMHAEDYLREGYRQLSDQQFYKALDSDPSHNITTKINAQ